MKNVKDKVLLKLRGFNSQRRNKEGYNLNKGKGIQCYECEGFGHIQMKRTKFLQNQNKGYTTMFYDDEYE